MIVGPKKRKERKQGRSFQVMLAHSVTETYKTLGRALDPRANAAW